MLALHAVWFYNIGTHRVDDRRHDRLRAYTRPLAKSRHSRWEACVSHGSNLMEPEPLKPAVGEWYADTQGVTFEVVAVDDEDGTIEVQYFDGTLEELDADAWNELQLKPVDPPEDWSGSLDIEREDYGVDLGEERHELWANPLDHLDH